MKRITAVLLTCLLLISIVPLHGALSASSAMLAENGRTDYVIVVGENASPAEHTAANTLADYLKRITGASFPVVTDAGTRGDRELIVGVTNRDGALGIDRSALDDDAVRIKTVDGSLYLTGGKARGALYAVYTFLEDFLGCRWFTHDLTVTPERDALPLPDADYSYAPPIKLRQTYWLFSTRYADFCAAHKLHGVMAYLPEELGGGRYEMAISSVHTMSSIVPASLFETHPEYFGMDENGNRTPYRQPCFSNPDVLSLAVAYGMNYFSSYNAVLSVSQNDGQDFCQCADCRAFNGAHGNTDAASLLRFVNAVAVEVRKTYPEAKIETLAYQRSQTPPTGIKPESNVVIRLCAIRTCALHALDDRSCASNRTFAADLAAWSALTENLYVWDYSTNFQYYYAPYPNLTHLQSRYQFFKNNGVVAVFDNGCGDDIVPAEFHELRTYLICKLLWDPDTDLERHMREFCEAYYGEAGADVIDFIRLFEDRVKGYNPLSVKTSHLSCSDGGENLEANTSLTEWDVCRLDAIMDAARKRNLTPDEAHRLEGLSLSWRFFKNATFAGEFNWLSGMNDPEEEARRLFHDLKDYGVLCLTENWGLYLREEEPDFKVRPAYWYLSEEELPSSVKLQAKLLPAVNRFLRVVFTVPRFFRSLF